jgi:ornithine cyclodeaminase/alanine dehydrogenase
MNKVLILSHGEVASLGITVKECVEAVEDVLKEHARNNVILYPKSSIKPKEGVFFTSMPAYVKKLGIVGIKWVNRFPGSTDRPRITASMFINDANNGRLLSVMDATWITMMRTGAVAAVTAKHLGKKGFDTVSFIGLGVTAVATLTCFLEMFPNIKNIKLFKYKDQAERFVKRFSHSRRNFIICDKMEDVFKNSDIIITAVTFAAKPFVKKEWLSDGMLALPIHTRGWQDCDPLFDKVYADDHAHVKDFMPEIFAEIGEVINGNKPGRENAKEKIIAYNIGIAIEDMALGKMVYDRALKKGVGQKIDLENFKDAFWL